MTECTNCRGTGMTHVSTKPDGERVFSGYLDCAAPGCSAALERAELMASLPAIAGELAEMIWAIHQRARRIEREAAAKAKG